MGRYRPANSFESPRFSGVRTFMRLPHITRTEGVDFVVAGVPFDTGTSFRPGARFGPEAIRSMSVLLRPYNPRLDIDIFRHCSGVDYGDLAVVPGYLEETMARIEESLVPILERGVVPILLGGDQSISLPALRAAMRLYGPPALIHFDAHPDTWDKFFGQRYFHGTPFRRAVEEGVVAPQRSIQVGLRGPLFLPQDWENSRRLGYATVTAEEMRQVGLAATVAQIRERVGEGPAYLSFDIDVVDPAYAPGTGTPEVAGLSSLEALALVEGLQGLHIVAFDLVEVSPPYDPAGITALLAANLAYAFISLVARRCKGAAAPVAAEKGPRRGRPSGGR